MILNRLQHFPFESTTEIRPERICRRRTWPSSCHTWTCRCCTLNKESRRSVTCKLATLIWSFRLLLAYLSTNKSNTGKSYQSYMACIRLSYCYAQRKFGLSISASSFIAFISQSNALVQEKMNQCDVPDTFLTPCFFTRGYKLLSLILSLPQLCFPVTLIFTSHAGCFMFPWV